MSTDQDNFKKEISRKGFLKLMGAGSLFLGLGALGIPNVLKTFGEASAGKIGSPSISEGNSANSTNTTIASSASPGVVNPSPDGMNIRPFNVNVPEEELTELRRRINATRWPEKELVTTFRKACSSRRFRNSRSIGVQIIIGARSNRDSRHCRSS